jgi:hypothetical protein
MNMFVIIAFGARWGNAPAGTRIIAFAIVLAIAGIYYAIKGIKK